MRAYSKRYCARPGVSLLVTRIRSNLNKSWNSRWIFWFSQCLNPFYSVTTGHRSILCNQSFLPLVELINRAVFSWKELNIYWLFFHSYVYFFENDLFLEWWNKCFGGSLNQNFLLCPTMVGRLFNNFSKLFLWILHFGGRISISFLKIKMWEISIFIFRPLSELFKILEKLKRAI